MTSMHRVDREFEAAMDERMAAILHTRLMGAIIVTAFVGNPDRQLVLRDVGLTRWASQGWHACVFEGYPLINRRVLKHLHARLGRSEMTRAEVLGKPCRVFRVL